MHVSIYICVSIYLFQTNYSLKYGLIEIGRLHNSSRIDYWGNSTKLILNRYLLIIFRTDLIYKLVYELMSHSAIFIYYNRPRYQAQHFRIKLI